MCSSELRLMLAMLAADQHFSPWLQSSRDSSFSGFLLAPSGGRLPKLSLEHHIEQAQGLIPAFQSNFDDLGFSSGQKLLGASEP
jgi:hypothetical protein